MQHPAAPALPAPRCEHTKLSCLAAGPPDDAGTGPTVDCTTAASLGSSDSNHCSNSHYKHISSASANGPSERKKLNAYIRKCLVSSHFEGD